MKQQNYKETLSSKCNFIATNYKMHHIVFINYDIILCGVCHSSVVFWIRMQKKIIKWVGKSLHSYSDVAI